jgi:hypothetical protein
VVVGSCLISVVSETIATIYLVIWSLEPNLGRNAIPSRFLIGLVIALKVRNLNVYIIERIMPSLCGLI